MSRAPKIRRPVRLLSLLAGVALCLVPALTARAASYVYGSRQRTVNAGVLFTGTAGAPLTAPANATPPAAPDPSPYVFYLFNQRTDVKPFGWNVVNPQAPSIVSAATAQRWTAYSIGQSVTQDMAAYWEVPLSDTSSAQLQQYDVLYLPLGGTLLPADNEKLRRFVDGGGQLWIESDPHVTPAPPNPGTLGGLPAFFNVSVATSGTTNGPALPGAFSTGFLRHPILSQPFLMSYDDLLGLGVTPGNSLSDASGFFGDALLSGTATSVSVSQYGAGQIVACALDVGGAINDFAGALANSSPAFPYNSGPFCGSPGTAHALSTANGFINTSAAPTADLRFLANLIALAGTHPNENKTGRQNASSNDLASFAPAWTYPVTPPSTTPANPPPGAAVWGNWVYVTTYGAGANGATGTLHAFDAYPAEFLTAIGQADDGKAAYQDFSLGKPYDEVWSADVGPNASAPTVASSGGSTSVYVEKADGSVQPFDAVTGAAGVVLTTGTAVTTGLTSYPSQNIVNAPAPVISNGQIYAGQPNSDLLVGPVAGGPGVRAPLAPTTTTEAVCGSPSVGVLADGDMTNDLVAIVPTTQNLYTLFLGARADLLQPVSGAASGYNVNRSRLRLFNLKLPTTPPDPNAQAYTFSGNPSGLSSGGGSSPDFNGTPPSGVGTAVYGDYDADLTLSYQTNGNSNGQTLNLNSIYDFSYGEQQANGGGNSLQAVVSAPATDRNGDLYYTVNAGSSYLFGVHEDPQFQNVRLKFRFRLPQTGESVTDGDGVVYDSLQGYQFVGAPVVDSNGLIYVAAKNGSSAAILCFSTTQPIYADASGAFDPSQATYTQADEFNATQPNQLRPGPVDGSLRYGQFSAVGNRVTFYNFGVGTGQIRQIAGNLSEPQPVQVTPNPDPNQAQQNLAAVTLPLHTNLVWFVPPFSVNGSISGLTKVGDTLYFSDSGTATAPSVLYSVNANGGSDGTAITNKQIAYNALNSGKRQMVAPAATLGLGATSATPSAGGQVLVINGLNGVAALTQQLTLVTDNNRILEVDSNGNAVWAVDSTARVTPAGATSVDFSHPASLSQVTPNDYLVADTGNNRCVRFDRAGDVIWELTHFNDPGGLLAPGQPLSLNAPTSVQMLRSKDGLQTHYLIADSGNSRVLEVTDKTDAMGNLLKDASGNVIGDHVLTFVSHTGDKFGRHYRYGSATYFNVVPSTGIPTSIVAAVTNTRLAPLNANGTLGPASGDAPGGTLIGFDYLLGQAAFGSLVGNTVTGVFTSFGVQQAVGGTNYTTYQVRNPRYLSVYVPPTPPATGPQFSLLYADDNGAFDLTPTTANGFVAYANNLHFTQADYETMPTPVVGVPNAPLPRSNAVPPIPFVPSCVQRINADETNPEYLITQSYSQPELGHTTTAAPTAAAPNPTPQFDRIGGEIFEVDVTSAGVITKSGGFGGSTLSRPGLTGPLTQPTSAIRPQQ